MCHLIFFLPVFALPVFWLFPIETAMTTYLAICALSLFLYYKVFKAMRAKIRSGVDAMVGKTAVVISDIAPEGKIRYATEIWNASAGGRTLPAGEKVVIKAASGLNLLVGEMPAEKP